MEFSIKFVENGVAFSYQLSIDLGTFLDIKHERKILKEVLFVNEELLFKRTDSLFFGNFKVINGYIDKVFLDNQISAIEIAKSNLKNDELFLTNGFRNIFSSKLVDTILDWISEKLIVVYRADSVYLSRRTNIQDSRSMYVVNVLNKAAKTFGINSNGLGYTFDGDKKETILCSLFQDDERGGIGIPADIFESCGTIRFVNLFPIIADALAMAVYLL